MAKDRILIVEDNESLILFYSGILAHLDIKIDTAKSYDEAISKLKEFDYCFHIIDITLEGDEPGTSLIGKCGAGPESCLILSASMTESVVTELVEIYGVPRHQINTKPVEADFLVELVSSKMVDNDEVHEENNNHNNANSDTTDSQTTETNASAEIYLLRFIWKYIRENRIKTLVFGIFLIVFMHFLITFWKIDAYNEIYNKITERNEQLFKYHNEAKTVSGTTYVEFSGYQINKMVDEILSKDLPDVEDAAILIDYLADRKKYIHSLRVQFYNSDNYHVIIMDDNGGIRKFWISDKGYLQELGIGQDLTFFQIFIKAWKESFKNL